MKTGKNVAIVATLDTKGNEVSYLKELIEKRGHQVLVIDAGVLREPLFEPDFSRNDVARAAGTTIQEVIAFGEWKKASEAMATGAKIIARRLCSEGKLDGIIGIGGTMGTTLGAIVMRDLPLFLPKVMISSVTFSPFFHSEIVSKDMVMIPTMVEFTGGITNDMIKTVIENAAGAISGMVESYQSKPALKRPLVGITSFGMPALKFDEWAAPLLKEKGYDVAVFPGAGSNFEEAVEAGVISASLDIMAAAQLINEVCGGINVPSRTRFEAGRKRGIPQVFAPGVVELFSCRPPVETLPRHLRERKTFQRSALIIAVQTSREEIAKAGKIMAQKLNEMTGPTAMLFPSRGFSEWDKPDAPHNFRFYNPEARAAFVEAFRENVTPHVKILEFDLHINDVDFAREAVAVLHDMILQRVVP